MKYFPGILLFVLLLGACNPVDAPPIGREKMGDILADIQLAEVYSSMVDDSLHRVMPKNQDSLAAYYQEVLAHHHTTLDEFEAAINWYKAHPQEMDSTYKYMVSQLSILEGMQQATKGEKISAGEE